MQDNSFNGAWGDGAATTSVVSSASVGWDSKLDQIRTRQGRQKYG
jgi:hypothetical protein